MSYIDKGQCVIRVADGAFIPKDSANSDYQAVLAWLASGHSYQSAPLAEQKAVKVSTAGAQYAQRLAAGVAHNGAIYQIDEDSQQRISAMGARAIAVIGGVAGASWPDGFAFIATDNSKVPMTAPEMYALSQAASDRVIALRVAFRAVKDAILAASDQAALDAIDVATGWPQ